ncbi:hypothetical protein B0H34DRAFT_642700, partial [Crassisporium funariophilum]
MDVFDGNQHMVYGNYFFNDCDTPAARKVSGTAGHSADLHPCLYCETVLIDVGKLDLYHPQDTSYNVLQLQLMLTSAFFSREALPQRQSAILKNHGVCWSVMNDIPNSGPVLHTALDFMHNVFLGVIAHFFTAVLFAAHMLPGAGGINSAKNRFENLINSIRWPSHVTQLPKNMGENHSLKKADEWRCLLTVTPVLLWYTWRDDHDDLPDSAPTISPNKKISTNHSRNRRKLYKAALLLCAGVRLPATRTITLLQAQAVLLVINHHLSIHLYDMVRLYGPVYGWWLFAFERFNGMFEKVNHTGHDGSQMESTLLRNW